MVVGIGSIEVKAVVLTASELVAMEICMSKCNYNTKNIIISTDNNGRLTLSDVADIVVVLATAICIYS